MDGSTDRISEGKRIVGPIVIVGSSDSPEWFRRAMFPDASMKETDGTAEEIKHGSSGLLFVPRFMGKTGKGGFLGIDNVHRRSHFAWAVLERFASANQLYLERMRKLGIDSGRIVMINGGAGARIWPRIVSRMRRICR